MRWHFRTVFGDIAFFMMLARYQKIEGINSQVNGNNNKHIILWDFDYIDLEEIKKSLLRVQKLNSLSNIYIYSDNGKSFHAECDTIVSFRRLLSIYIQTDHLDYDFFKYCVLNRKSVLRTSRKEGREQLKLIDVLQTFFVYPPKILGKELYDAPLNKDIKEINMEIF